MTANERLYLIKRAVLRALADCAGFAVLETAIREAVSIKVDHLQPTTVEIDVVLRIVDTERLSVAINTERGRKLKLTDTGTLWLAENP